MGFKEKTSKKTSRTSKIKVLATKNSKKTRITSKTKGWGSTVEPLGRNLPTAHSTCTVAIVIAIFVEKALEMLKGGLDILKPYINIYIYIYIFVLKK